MKEGRPASWIVTKWGHEVVGCKYTLFFKTRRRTDPEATGRSSELTLCFHKMGWGHHLSFNKADGPYPKLGVQGHLEPGMSLTASRA